MRSGRLGEVMGRVGGYVQLRPVGGGREWDCPPESVEPASPGEVLRERVGRLNRQARLREAVESPPGGVPRIT
ncbi:hypothetical protein AB0E10_05305 [Streptomyces sp. NPDC048045]|uniref:hypothetical protein n=1 Tax=Streptomyces sp. NPDC048045 TaxID=3154710 RepID=UPI0034271DEA